MSSWDDSRVEALKKLWADGLSASQIAARLGGTTRNAVIGKISRLRLPPRVTTSRVNAARNRNKHQPYIWHRNKGKPFVFTNKLPPLPQLPLPPAEEYDRARVSVIEVKDKECRWPVGDPAAAGAHNPLFCGLPAVLGQPYCEVHCRRAFIPPRPTRADIRIPAMPATSTKVLDQEFA